MKIITDKHRVSNAQTIQTYRNGSKIGRKECGSDLQQNHYSQTVSDYLFNNTVRQIKTAVNSMTKTVFDLYFTNWPQEPRPSQAF